MNLRNDPTWQEWRNRMAALFDTGWFHWATTNHLRPVAFAYRFKEVSFPPVNDNSPQFPLLPLSTD